MKAEAISRAQGIPPKFLENILLELRQHAGIVLSQRGAEGGYRLGLPANEITLADVIRVVDGPLANVRGLRPERLEYTGPATSLLKGLDRAARQHASGAGARHPRGSRPLAIFPPRSSS